jgi:quercetin dioxygenase-like cupin family protein
MVNFEEEFKAVEGQWAFDPQTKHNFSDGLYAKEMIMPKGHIAYSHKHPYSHLSILAKGRVILKTEAYNKEYVAPACINIEANTYHQIESLEDCVWFCIHATEETDCSKIDEVLIEKN